MEIDSYHIRIGNATDVGRVRDGNEDYMAHFHTVLGYCVVVCDGMGGHAAGEIASQNAVDAIKHFLQDGKITRPDTEDTLRSAIEFANYKLRDMVHQDHSLKGMGTTCVLALFNGAEMYVAHAGDSRLYLIRNREIIQITKDHSTVQNLIDKGALTEKEAELSDKRNEITKAIGIFEKVEPAVTAKGIPLLQNDIILLCSDGLTAHLNCKTICDIVLANDDVQLAAIQLIEEANRNGGSDNITVQLIHYTGPSSKNNKKSKKGKNLLFIIVIALLSFAIGFLVYWKVIPYIISKGTPADTTLLKDGFPVGTGFVIMSDTNASQFKKDQNDSTKHYPPE